MVKSEYVAVKTHTCIRMWCGHQILNMSTVCSEVNIIGYMCNTIPLRNEETGRGKGRLYT